MNPLPNTTSTEEQVKRSSYMKGTERQKMQKRRRKKKEVSRSGGRGEVSECRFPLWSGLLFPAVAATKSLLLDHS